MPIHLEPSPDNVHWGYFDARLSPRLAIDSGERVTISSVSGGPELMPGPPLVVPPALPAIHAKVPICGYAPTSSLARAYRELGKEVLARGKE